MEKLPHLKDARQSRDKVAEKLGEIEIRKAKERQLSTLKKGDKKPDVENLPPREDKGKTRDKVAEKLGEIKEVKGKCRPLGLSFHVCENFVVPLKDTQKQIDISNIEIYNTTKTTDKRRKVAGDR